MSVCVSCVKKVRPPPPLGQHIHENAWDRKQKQMWLPETPV